MHIYIFLCVSMSSLSAARAIRFGGAGRRAVVEEAVACIRILGNSSVYTLIAIVTKILS